MMVPMATMTTVAGRAVASAVAAVAAAEQPQAVAPTSVTAVAPAGMATVAPASVAGAVAAVAAAEQPQAVAPASMAAVAGRTVAGTVTTVAGIAMTSMAAVAMTRLHRFGGSLNHRQTDHGDKRRNPHQQHSVHLDILLCGTKVPPSSFGFSPPRSAADKAWGKLRALRNWSQKEASFSRLSK